MGVIKLYYSDQMSSLKNSDKGIIVYMLCLHHASIFFFAGNLTCLTSHVNSRVLLTELLRVSLITSGWKWSVNTFISLPLTSWTQSKFN